MIIGHPGSWQQFQFRPDNKGLNVMEMKSKYLHEQYLFEAKVLNQIHQQNMFMNGGGGGPLFSSSEPTYSQELKLVFNTTLSTVSSNYGFDVTSFENWNNSGYFSDLNAEAISFDNDTGLIILKSNTASGTQITNGAFDSDGYLVEIEDINSNYIEIIRIGAFNASSIGSIILNAVTEIQNGNTFSNISLTTLQLDNLTNISNTTTGNGAFYLCDLSSASSIRFANLSSIGDYVFEESSLVEITDSIFPSLSSIGDFGFLGATINSINSSTIQTIGDRAFSGSSIINLTLTNSVSFSSRAFANAGKLAEVNLPTDCTFSTNDIFLNAKALGTANVSVNNAADDSIKYLELDRGWTIITP